MAPLQKKIDGDWIETREASKSMPTLFDYLEIDPSVLRQHVDRLRHSVEQGIVECKRSWIGPVFMSLENMKYKTLDLAEMDKQRRAVDVVLLTTLAQRLITMGAVQLASDHKKGDGESPGDKLEINAIISVIRERITQDPNLRQHAAVKNILMQVNLYTREYGKMKDLLANIKPEKRRTFVENFQTRFGGIFASIKKSYAALEIDETPVAGKSILNTVRMDELTSFLAGQAQGLSEVRSTLVFARDERYRMRELIVGLYERREETLKLIDRETVEYAKICGASVSTPRCVASVANAFRDEIAELIERKL